MHGKTIVSPITALYDCPLDINFGADAELSYSKVWYCCVRLLSIDLPVNIVNQEKNYYKIKFTMFSSFDWFQFICFLLMKFT